MSNYMRARGKLMVAPRDLSLDEVADLSKLWTNMHALRWLGNTPDFTPNLAPEVFRHKEKWSGADSTDLTANTANGGSVNFTIEDITAANLQYALSGRPFTPPSTAVTGAALAEYRLRSDGKNYKWVMLDKNVANKLPTPNAQIRIARGIVDGEPDIYTAIDVSSIVITDSAGTPATLTLGTHYAVGNLTSQTANIRIIDVSGFTGPLKVAFSVLSQTDVLHEDLEFNRWYALTTPKIGTLVVKDSTGSPKTVTSTLYEVDYDYGMIRFTNSAGFDAGNYTLPLKVQYAPSTVTQVPLLTLKQNDVRLFLRGENVLTGQKLIVDLYRVNLQPASSLPLLDDEMVRIPMKGDILLDPAMPADSVLGRFGRVMVFN